MILDFFRHKQKCLHTHIPVDADEAYCPDCGELVRNKWYLVRCSCCNIKRVAHEEFDDIKPETKFCPNCGSSEYYIEELKEVNFTDLPYCVLKCETVNQIKKTVSQIWVDNREQITETKLLSFNK